MRIPNLTLAYQIAELKPLLEGSMLRKVQELGNNWLKLRFQTRQGSKDLILAPNTLFLTSHSLPAKQTTSGYGAFLRKQLQNSRLLSLSQHGLDRVAVLEFPKHFLIAELFAKGNLILLNREMLTLSAFRKEQWKDRSLRKAMPYKFPSSKGASPTALTPQALKKTLAQGKSDVARALIAGVNIAPLLAELACSKAGIPKSKKPSSLKQSEIAALSRAVSEIYSVDLKGEKAVLVEKEGEKILLPFQVPLPDAKTLQQFPSVNAALDSIFSASFAQAATAPETRAAQGKVQELERNLARQKKAVNELQAEIALNRAKAEAIYANYPQISALLQAVGKGKLPKSREKEIMYKLKKRFPLVKDINISAGRALLLLPEKEKK